MYEVKVGESFDLTEVVTTDANGNTISERKISCSNTKQVKINKGFLKTPLLFLFLLLLLIVAIFVAMKYDYWQYLNSIYGFFTHNDQS
jgi:hypothetical protein